MTSVVRIHHLPPKEPILIRVSVLFWCQVEWIRKPALRNVPVARFNRRGFRRNGSESTTGRAGTRVAVRPWAAIANHDRHAPNPKGRTGCSIAKSTCTGYWERYIVICDVRTVCARISINDNVQFRRTRFALRDIWCKTMSLNKQALRFSLLPFVLI